MSRWQIHIPARTRFDTLIQVAANGTLIEGAGADIARRLDAFDADQGHALEGV